MMMKQLVLKTGVGILHLVYLFFRRCKIKNKITYMSRQSDSMSLDFEILVSKIRTEYPQVENVVLTRKITDGKKSVVTYPFHMIRQMYHLATSKVVIVDGYCIVVCVLPHKKETKVIQMWHAAAAIKKFGYQTLDKYSGSDSKTAEIMKMHHNYDYVLAPSKATGKHYCEAFGVESNKLLYIGMPHFSELKTFDRNKEMSGAYPELQNKQNILYIPTFRKGECVHLEELIRGVDFEKYNLIARLHPLEKLKKIDEKVIVDTRFTVYEWIKKADIIIADYSSLIIECALLEKQIYFFLYDIDKYSQDPGLNINLRDEEIRQFMFFDGAGLKKLLDKAYDFQILTKFREKYVEVDVDNSAKELVEFIAKLM